MSPQTHEKRKAAGGQPATQNIDRVTDYTQPKAASRRKPMEQAAEVALLLALYPLTVAERLGFALLLEQRLRRVYGGLGR